MTLDPRHFRRTLGNFATGVTVVTARSVEGDLLGVTVSSFNAVSLDPPLVLFSLDRRASSAPAYEAAGRFAINVLGDHQLELCERFALAGTDKWDGVDYIESDRGLPVLPGSLAVFECRLWACHDGGDHKIFIGAVEAIRDGADGEPLLFYRGGFHAISEF